MKKLMVSVSLGLASVSQAQAWTGGIEDMRTMQANDYSTVVRVKSKRVECCRTRPGHAHGHSHQVKRIHQGRTYYCADATAQHSGSGHYQQQRVINRQHQAPRRHVAPRPNYQAQQQAQRNQRQAMYAAKARAKAAKLAQMRKRAAQLEQQKRLANQKRRAARQAALKAQQQRRAALLAQKRKAIQLAQQRRVAHAQQPRQVVRHHVQQPRQVVRHVQQPRQVVVQHVQQQPVVIERRTYPTYVSQTHVAPAPVVVQAPRIASQQSVARHDARRGRSVGRYQRGMASQSVDRHDYQQIQIQQQHVQQQRIQQQHVQQQRIQQQRIQQARTAQIKAQQQYQVQRMEPMRPVIAPAPVKRPASGSGYAAYGWKQQHQVSPAPRRQQHYVAPATRHQPQPVRLSEHRVFEGGSSLITPKIVHVQPQAPRQVTRVAPPAPQVRSHQSVARHDTYSGGWQRDAKVHAHGWRG